MSKFHFHVVAKLNRRLLFNIKFTKDNRRIVIDADEFFSI